MVISFDMHTPETIVTITGKVTLLQNLAGLLVNTEVTEREDAQERILSILTKDFDRQDLGGLLGELGGLLGGLSGTPAPVGEAGGTNELLEGLVEQVIQQQINEFFSSGGIENILSSLLNTEDIGQMFGEMVGSMMGGMDVSQHYFSP